MMKNIIKKILVEMVDSLGVDQEESTNISGGESYIVFVAGTNTTGVAHQKQYDAFDNGLSDSESNVMYFNYDTHQNKGSELYTWLDANSKSVNSLVLFSAACSLANKLSPKYVPTSKTYCIEPWASENGKETWTNIPPNNFYVNATNWKRGAGAKDGIPEKNKNNLTSHTAALTDAVSKIF